MWRDTQPKRTRGAAGSGTRVRREIFASEVGLGSTRQLTVAVPGQIPRAGCTGSGVGCSVVPADVHIEGPVTGEAWGGRGGQSSDRPGITRAQGVSAPHTQDPHKPRPPGVVASLEWSSFLAPPTRPEAPPIFRALLWVPPTKQVPATNASQSARPFLDSTPNPAPFTVHFRSHPPSVSPAQDTSPFKLHLWLLPRGPLLPQTPRLLFQASAACQSQAGLKPIPLSPSPSLAPSPPPLSHLLGAPRPPVSPGTPCGTAPSADIALPLSAPQSLPTKREKKGPHTPTPRPAPRPQLPGSKITEGQRHPGGT